MEYQKWLNEKIALIKWLENTLEREKEILQSVKVQYEETSTFDPQIDFDEPKKQPILTWENYQESWTWNEKLLFILKMKDEPLQLGDFKATLLEREPDLSYNQELTGNISKLLSKLTKSGQLTRFKRKGQRAGYYLFPNWLNDQGEIKPEYREKMLFM